MRLSQTVEKPLWGLTTNFCSLTRAEFIRTLRLICIFPEVHAPVENDFHFIGRRSGKLVAAVSGITALQLLYALRVLRGFFDSLKKAGHISALLLF